MNRLLDIITEPDNTIIYMERLPDIELIKGPFVPCQIVYRNRGGFVVASNEPNWRYYKACPNEVQGKWFWSRKQAADYVDNHGLIQPTP
jgi:hypothetical protein